MGQTAEERKTEMKVFTTTFYRNNYGSALQAFALQQVLIRFGADPVIMEPPLPPVSPRHRKGVLSRVKHFFRPEKHYGIVLKARRILERRIYRKKSAKIDAFLKEHVRTQAYEICREQIEAAPCILMAGSDQIWNTLNHDLPGFHYFKDIENPRARRCSYAASTGISEFSPEQIAYYQTVLKQFDTVSFRERSVYLALSPHLSNREVRCDPDPTLLLGGEFWQTLASPRLHEAPYVFVYMLRPDRHLITYAKTVARALHCSIVYMGQYVNYYPGVRTVADAGVPDFLSYILHAETVITNSFHGTVFSVLFKKRFASAKIASTSTRAEDLLERLSLQNQLITRPYDTAAAMRDYDRAPADDALAAMRTDAAAYLKSLTDSPDCAFSSDTPT